MIKADTSDEELRVKIDAHVVRQLGEELISDPEQAILELVKNSYDADSKWCSIEIDTEYEEATKETKDKKEVKYQGKITIKDAGVGMTLIQLAKSWLTISHSEKRNYKKQKTVTKEFNRAYQGDKGLGRISTMKLGKILKITTSKENETGTSVQLNWEDFQEGKTLDQVDVTVKEGLKIKKGSLIEIIGLNDIKHWKGESAGKRIQSKLSTLISPFEFDDTFKVILSINKTPFSLTTFNKKVMDFTVVQFKYTYDKKKLKCQGRVKLPFYRQQGLKEKEYYKRYIGSDDGEKLFEFLPTFKKKLASYKIKRSNNKGWYLDFTKTYLWEDMPKDEFHLISNIGQFEAEWNYIFKSGAAYEELHKKNKPSKYDKEAIDNLIGIGVYKNKFRVGSDPRKDWLGLSADKTSGQGFYSLRPENVIGFIRFDGYEGEPLKEKSDRQGFDENNYFHGFWVITREMIAFANDFLNESRRTANEFILRQREKEEGKPESYNAEQAAVEISDLVESVSKSDKQIKKSAEDASNSLSNAKKHIQSASNDLLLDKKAREELEKLQAEISMVDEKFFKFSLNYRNIMEQIKDHEYTAEKIIKELESYKSKINDFYDTASIGLSAENLAHEVNPQLDEITLNTNKAKNRLVNLKVTDKGVFNNLNQVLATTKVIAKDISLINPMVRSRRNQFSEFNIVDAINDYTELRKEKLDMSGIKVVLTDIQDGLIIKFVRGKFTQVLDNLFRNSEYWLDHASKHQEISKRIFIEISSSGFFFWDSGPGININMEEVLFDMFASGKSKKYGNGLGLFIINNILEQQDCSIFLMDDRNETGRKYKFAVDLTGALING